MNKSRILLIASASAVLTLGMTTAAQAATPVLSSRAAGASAADLTYVHDNAQTDLAEITIGKIALTRAQTSAAKDLATTTIADHEAALAKLETVATTVKVSLPTAPNAAQQADAATLQSVAAGQFDATYAQIQIAGHKLSIAGTQSEIASGSDAAVTTYASGYLPVAQMHLTMSENLLASVSAASGAAPTAVPAGTGGMGATTSSAKKVVELMLGAFGLILVGFAATALLRRRRLS